MTTSIPLGFHTFSISFTCVGSTHNIVTTCSGKNNTYLTAQQIDDAWRLALCGSGKPFTANALSVNYSVLQTKTLANIGGLLQVHVNTTAITGTGALDVPGVNTAVLVNKPTGFAGRRYRGRMFSPPLVTEANVLPNATINSAGLAILQGQWTQAFAQIKTTAGIDPVLLHEDSLALVPTAITGFIVGGRMGTIGRRLRR